MAQRFYTTPEGAQVAVTDSDQHPAGEVPDGWVEVTEAEHTSLLQAARQAGEAASAALLQADRQTRATELVEAGFTAAQATALVGVPTGQFADTST